MAIFNSYVANYQRVAIVDEAHFGEIAEVAASHRCSRRMFGDFQWWWTSDPRLSKGT